MTTHVRIIQRLPFSSGETVIDLPEWEGQIPRKGDYVYQPPLHIAEPPTDARPVTQVTWRMHDRAADGFVMAAHPYVEIRVGF